MRTERALRFVLVLGACLGGGALPAQSPSVRYTLRVDSADLSGWHVEMRVRHSRDTFSIAMARHPEYDDRYWRNVRALSIESPNGTATVARAGDAIWEVRAAGGEATVRYRIQLSTEEPVDSRASWRPFLSPTGGLTGGPHAFMYVVGDTSASAQVTLEIPGSWRVATALTRTFAPNVFDAPSVYSLVESPILMGHLREWTYEVEGIPHRVVYWPLPNAIPFDTAIFVQSLAALSKETIAMFGSAPYAMYTFLIQDGAYGGLEHPSSVTLGSRSGSLAENPREHLQDAAHEFVHTWNLMRIRPVEYRGVDHREPEMSPSLWFSEGFTIYYADALLRRAGLPSDTAAREDHLAVVAQRYLGNEGALTLSAEAVSRAEYSSNPVTLGDYLTSPHQQGEVIATVLDFVIRDATGGAKSMDDVMRAMLARFGGVTGFTGKDVERVIGEVCGCSVTPFFDAHVRGGSPIDVKRYLALAGLSLDVQRAPALDRDGKAAADFRIAAFQLSGAPFLRLQLFQPSSAWGRAGLHSGDELVSMNGRPVKSFREMRDALSRTRIGDTITLAVNQGGQRRTVRVPVTGYQTTRVRVTKDASATPKAIAIRERWLRGN